MKQIRHEIDEKVNKSQDFYAEHLRLNYDFLFQKKCVFGENQMITP